ncbi:hypothetical protein VL20_6235 [Microcystis panniformis FACHB-1757]|nr:hypothetical protein VL20_6235 [Microcystis panniformis FACHB-1757]
MREMLGQCKASQFGFKCFEKAKGAWDVSYVIGDRTIYPSEEGAFNPS